MGHPEAMVITSSGHQNHCKEGVGVTAFCVAVSRCNRQGHSIVWLHHGIYAIKVVRISVKFPCNNTTTNYSHHQNRTCKDTLTQSKLDRGITNSLGGFIDEFKATSLGSSHKIQHLTGMERWKATAVSCQTKCTDHLKNLNLGKMRAAKGHFNLSICPSSYIYIYIPSYLLPDRTILLTSEHLKPPANFYPFAATLQGAISVHLLETGGKAPRRKNKKRNHI